MSTARLTALRHPATDHQPPRRTRFGRAGALALAVGMLAAAAGTGLAQGASGSGPKTTAAGSPQPPGQAYYLVDSAGRVTAYGQAGYWGDTSKIGLKAPIVGATATGDHSGYWLVGSDGGIFSFGDAHFVGSAGSLRLNKPVVEMAATADGKGYWLVASDGGIFNYGDAHFYGSAGSTAIDGSVIGMAPTTDGKGYWLATSAGQVLTYGDAVNYGSMQGRTLNRPVVAIASTADGRGYWLVGADGGIFNFGDAAFFGSAASQRLTIDSMATTPDGRGYWMATSSGQVVAFGDAPFYGDQSQPSSSPDVAIAGTVASGGAGAQDYPAGAIGYDLNWPQCSGPSSTGTVPLPGPPTYPAGSSKYSVAIVGVDGWAVDDPNPCLAAEAHWAKAATDTGSASYGLYMLLNAPASTSTIDQTGPAGTCADDGAGSAAWASCLAYNYGWNSAEIAVQYAAGQGASAKVWWLDIENPSCSSSNFNQGGSAPWSCDTTLNDRTIQGSIDALHSLGLTAGIYSTYLQWGEIMGRYSPPGPSIPLWVAGAPWTSPPYPSAYGYLPISAVGPWCDGSYDFAGGTPWMVQETPGMNDYPFDPDVSCG